MTSQTTVFTDLGKNQTRPTTDSPMAERSDDTNCFACEVSGGYCGMCSGGYWANNAYKTEQ